MPNNTSQAVKKASRKASSAKLTKQDTADKVALGIEAVVKAAAESLLGYMIMLARRNEASVLHESALYEPFHLTVLSRGYILRHEVRIEERDGKRGDKRRVDFAIYKKKRNEQCCPNRNEAHCYECEG